MSLAKFRKVFKGPKKPDSPSPKVSPENTSPNSNDTNTPNSTPFIDTWRIIS